jgi:hypothetical protein
LEGVRIAINTPETGKFFMLIPKSVGFTLFLAYTADIITKAIRRVKFIPVLL